MGFQKGQKGCRRAVQKGFAEGLCRRAMQKGHAEGPGRRAMQKRYAENAQKTCRKRAANVQKPCRNVQKVLAVKAIPHPLKPSPLIVITI